MLLLLCRLIAHGIFPVILLKMLHPDAFWYAATLSQGTYTGIVFDTLLKAELSTEGGLSAFTYISVKPMQPEKANIPIKVTEFPIVTEVKPRQTQKAHFPIVVTELGTVTEVNPMHSEKASFPIEVTPCCMSKVLMLYR
jgi:hypothetical protein